MLLTTSPARGVVWLRNGEASLPPNRFVRIHRSYLLNLERLARIEPDGSDTRTAILPDGSRLPVSRPAISG
jgi:two-component system LytT family response regulator